MLEVEGISKKYGDFVALKNLSFSVGKGEILGLIGENGAGKSTTLKILAGLIEPDSGEVRYFGAPLNENVRRRMGYLPEIDALYDNMMVFEYLSFFAEIYGVSKSRIRFLMEMLSLPDKFIGDLSKGMKRKVSIARTLLHDPDVLIYDEPTGGLDPGVSLKIAELMRDLAKKGKIIVFSAHNMYYVEKIADRVIILKGGEALYYGSLGELISGNTVYRVEYSVDGKREAVEVTSVEDLAEIVGRISREGGKILEVDKEVPRLENIYFRLLGLEFQK